MMADTNATSSNGGTSGEAVPQWKKELLQRRKNLAKTIGAASVPVHDSASTVAAALTTPTTPRGTGPVGNPFGGPNANSTSSGQKDPPSEATSSSPTATSPSDASPPAALALALVDNLNRDSPASPTATAAFGTPVFVGHSPSTPPGNELPQQQQQQVLVKSLGRPTNTATREATGVLHAAGGTSEKQPLQHTQQSHSNDGPESTSIGSNSRAVAAAAAAAVAPNSGPVGKYAATAGAGVSGSVECEQQLTTRPASGETNSYSSGNSENWKLKKNTSSASSPNGCGSSSQTVAKMVAASAEEIVYEKNRFVGNGGTNTGAAIPGEGDPAEELKYGPGIVSKLRCRYLSLALRQSANKQRPSLNSMRRATSLNNLLDEESEDLSERETSIEATKDQDKSSQQYGGKLGREQQQNQLNLREQQYQQQHQQKAKTPDEYISTFQKSVQNSYARSGRHTEKKNEYNRYNKQRGADSLKRARSVEALMRYDVKAWERDIQKENLYSSNDSNVIILDEICSNGTVTNNGISNNCQSVTMNKTAGTPELIVDCVTIEEKIINGREKGDPKPKRLTSFIDADERPPPDVVRQTMKIFEANVNRRGRPVARTNGAAGEVAAKVASYKSIISQEKPPITHPKPPLSPKKPNIIPRSTSPKSNGTTNTAATNGLKDKPPILPKLDLNVIRTNLETTNNAKNAATPPTPPIQNNNVTSTPLSVRVEPPQAYRLKYESPALSPNNNTNKGGTTTTTTATNRAESPRFSTAAAALPANMQNNTNSTAATFVDSPSIQALTSKLNSLNIATSTPTSTRSPTPSDPSVAAAVTAANPTPPQVPPRGVLQYTTSDEEEDDPDDPEQREYSINSDRGSDSQPDDLELDDSAEDDDDDEPDTSKTVSRAAMDNIAKAGVTTQFRFNGQGSGQNKSHLPGHNNGGSTGVKLLASKRLNVDDQSSNSSSTSSSPITVPPAVVVTQKPPVPLSRESLSAANGLKSAPNSSVTANSNSLNNHSSSNANTSVNSNGSKLVINASDSASAPPPQIPTTVSSDVKTASLTAREIEKNQINLEKSGSEEASEKVVVPAKAPNNSDASSGGGDFFMAKWGLPAATPAATGVPVLVKKKVKAPPPPLEANTMVFNFSDRKDVPDYIENDGIILRPRPRELPKPGESGFVLLDDLTVETSTDPDDSWTMGPPSPCDVEFANANIVINGKSSMRNKTSRDSKFKIQFDDSLTSTFEYPSETSLLETNGFDAAAAAAATTAVTAADRTLDSVVDAASAANNAGQPAAGGGGGGPGSFPDNGLLSHKNTLLSSMPLGSAPFASYTPVKAAIDTTFELGVTRTPSPSSTSSSASSNEHPAQHQQHQHQQQHHANGGTNGITSQQQRFNNGTDSTATLLNGQQQQQQQESGEPESIQYLKPASDEQTVNWSQGTRVTDLLF